MSNRLPILATAFLIYSLVIQHIGYVVKIVIPWVGIALVTSAALTAMTGDPGIWFSESDPVAEMPSDPFQILDRVARVGFWVPALVSAIAWASVAVLWHRYLLRGNQAGWLRLGFGGKAISYVFCSLGITVITSIITFVSILIIGIFFSILIKISIDYKIPNVVLFSFSTLFGSILYLSFASRLSLALPAISIGNDDIRLVRSWTITKGNGFHMALISILIFLPPIAVQTVMGFVERNGYLPSFVTGFVSHVAGFLYVIAAVTLLSVAYGRLVEDRPVG